MFYRAAMIRCRHCKRLFSSYADHCPDCYAKSPRGLVRITVIVMSSTIAVAALVLTVIMLVTRAQTLPKPQPKGPPGAVWPRLSDKRARRSRATSMPLPRYG